MIEVAAAIIENEHGQFVSGELELVDHDRCEWVYLKELAGYEFAPADVKFVKFLSGN